VWHGGQTSLFPYGLGNSKAQAGSDGVANFVAAPYNNGSITYVEYGYALERNFPVVSVLNQAGYFTQPTAENVAIALQRAHINPDRTQVLHDVYRNPDARAYPVSSYSYMIVPTSTVAGFTPAKGDTLGKFILYFLCTGQQKAKQLGYSPLPANLVQYGFDAEKLVPGAPAPPPMSQCANPTITGGFTAGNAPPPPQGDRQGAQRPPLVGSPGGSGGSSGGLITQSNSPGGTTSTTGNITTGNGKQSAKNKASKNGSANSSGNGGTSTDGQNIAQAPISITHGAGDGVTNGVYVLVALVILAAVFLPPALAVALRRRN
jgi:hypothetical protein